MEISFTLSKERLNSDTLSRISPIYTKRTIISHLKTIPPVSTKSKITSHLKGAVVVVIVWYVDL